MKVVKRIYLPSWQRWVMVPMMVGIWLFTTYMEFFNPDNSEKMGMIGYGFMTILFLGLSVMMWLMTGGKLPAYIVKEEREK